MIEKVNPSHPDKVADRIAGALVDLAYTKNARPKIAVEVLIGHGVCHIITEASEHFTDDEVRNIVWRITASPLMKIDYKEVPQDAHLAANQEQEARCGDNGIFKGVPTSTEEQIMSKIVRDCYKKWPTDGKFIYSLNNNLVIACQSNAEYMDVSDFIKNEFTEEDRSHLVVVVNPLGDWTGGPDVDTGATNRKLGSDMGRAVTGGGLHGKDLSKADVAVNIVCHILAQKNNAEVTALCAIGDDTVEFRSSNSDETLAWPYSTVLSTAEMFVDELGGFEKLAEWGLF